MPCCITEILPGLVWRDGLHRSTTGLHLPDGAADVVVGSAAWLAWLNDPATRSFAFRVQVVAQLNELRSNSWLATSQQTMEVME